MAKRARTCEYFDVTGHDVLLMNNSYNFKNAHFFAPKAFAYSIVRSILFLKSFSFPGNAANPSSPLVTSPIIRKTILTNFHPKKITAITCIRIYEHLLESGSIFSRCNFIFRQTKRKTSFYTLETCLFREVISFQ